MALVLASGSRFAMLARFAAAFDSAPLRASLGQIVSTPGALEALRENGSTGMEFLRRHMTGDWGDLCNEDRQENDLSVKAGFRILSAYQLRGLVRSYGSSPKPTAAQPRFFCRMGIDPILGGRGLGRV